ncbi:phenylalanine--tRNA ligase subunit beta [candidate division WOR-3 bacterium]|nr:phenylalanine--tRNA ligase subunit beta [candidate division WOR-3 bacterium]
MPVVNIPVAELTRLVGRNVPRDELRVALEQLGNDVEGYARVIRTRCGKCGNLAERLEHEEPETACPACGAAEPVAAGESDVVRIELLPVRPDLFDVAGLARALRGFLGIGTGLPDWPVTDSGFRVEVAPGMESVRPHIVAAVVRGLELDDERLRMVMKMQENLHWALGRDRRRASIGVYDLAKVKPGFRFRPVGPDELTFVPLFGVPGDPQAGLTPREILERHPKGRDYAYLLAGMKRYPLLEDSTGRVLSMPPIINSDETRVTAGTRDLFIDVTGPDPRAIDRSLNVMVTALADIGGNIESVLVAYPDGIEKRTPDLVPARAVVRVDNVRRVVGVDLTAGAIAGCLERLRHGAEPAGEKVLVRVPAYRSDVMHEYDLVEDVAIGHGFERVEPRLVPAMTVGRPLAGEERAEKVRRVLTGLGFLEVMTLVLTNPREQFELLRLEPPPPHPVIANPLNVDQSMPRVHLLTGLLSTFRGNTARELPQRIFEVGECYAHDPEAETGVRVLHRVAAGVCGPKAGFADARALASALARELAVEVAYSNGDHQAFIPERCACILGKGGGDLGVLGEVRPEVLLNFGLAQPVALLEFNLDLEEE